jgi:hypothetical protein
VSLRPGLSSTPKSNSFQAQESSPPADSIESRRQRLAELVGQLLAERWLRDCHRKKLDHRESEESGTES